jgi:hypothetical protein
MTYHFSKQEQEMTSSTTTFQLDGATLTVDTQTLFKAWLEKNLQGLPTPAPLAMPVLNEGEHYAGIVFGKNNEPNQHIILLRDEIEGVNWSSACSWAASIGGSLPTRREQSLLFTNLKEQFKQEWYWSDEQHAANSGFAWQQTFNYGYQDYLHKSDEVRARAVRRLAI